MLSEGGNITLRGYVTVFPSLEFAEADKRERMSANAVGAALIDTADSLPLEAIPHVRRSYQRSK